MPEIGSLFASGGALERVLDNYRPRAGQVEMAQRVQAVLAEGGGQCVLEAGTGIGKTFAYLTPIIQSGKTALISTGARALQDQLSGKDIPLLKEVLQRDISVAVLKGRANYVCKKQMTDDSDLFKDDIDDWQKIRQFAGRSEDGDIRYITEVPSTSPLLARAVSTRESCTTQACEHFNECFLYRARERARRADIVIVNHHLFLSDMRLRDEGVAELLPSRDVVLFDEAHQLPELAPRFFGERISGAHLKSLMTQLERTVRKMKNAQNMALLSFSRNVRDALEKWQEASNSCVHSGSPVTAAEIVADDDWLQAARGLEETLQQLARALMGRVGGEESMEKFAQRVLMDVNMLKAWLNGESALSTAAAEQSAVEESEEMDEAQEQESDPIVRWADQDGNGNITLHSAPMTGRNLFARQWEKMPTLFFTSATLSVGGDFSDFCEATGLSSAETHTWESPYDFPGRALLYLPPTLPLPTEAEAHTRAVVDAALPLLLANGGRAFMLFTSWRALNQAHTQLQPLMQEAGITIFKQGEMSNDELLRRFRAESCAVLLGSQSFWQGVDVRGEALSLLVVDKVPFTPPSDPLLKARDEWRKQRGENAFMRNQLPPAVLLMKQVAGRLIRDYDDYGVFMMGDLRLLKKSYGQTILSALPPMRRCSDAAEAEMFLRQWSARRAKSHAAEEMEAEEAEGWE